MKKHDQGKLRPSLVINSFARALQEVIKVGTFGADKYTDDGWVKVPNGEQRYTDAMYRHLLAEATGESRDQESGELHAAHAAWNALARLDLQLRGKETSDVVPSRKLTSQQTGTLLYGSCWCTLLGDKIYMAYSIKFFPQNQTPWAGFRIVANWPRKKEVNYKYLRGGDWTSFSSYASVGFSLHRHIPLPPQNQQAWTGFRIVSEETNNDKQTVSHTTMPV